MSDLNDKAREWALCDERERSDRLFEDVARAADKELRSRARAVARQLAGADNADDAINTAWEKVLKKQRPRRGGPADGAAREDPAGIRDGEAPEQIRETPDKTPGGYDPDRAPFGAYFLMVLASTSRDLQRSRGKAPMAVPDDTMEWRLAEIQRSSAPTLLETQVADSLDGRIAAAIEVLDISDRHREMLRLLTGADPEDAEPTSAADRKARERLRRRLGQLAELSDEELRVAALMRKHHSIAAAAAAAGEDARQLAHVYTSAKRKVLALFGIGSED